MAPMKYWEIVADKLSAGGWSWPPSLGNSSTFSKRRESPLSEIGFLGRRRKYSEHEIRVESDNKTVRVRDGDGFKSAQKGKYNEYIDNMESA